MTRIALIAKKPSKKRKNPAQIIEFKKQALIEKIKTLN